jgi:hypothetical protein
MTLPTAPASYHILLVGIDAYAKRPLRGCVNDIDAVQRILLERLRVPAARITRLASPHPDTPHATEVPELPATLANLRAALAALAGTVQAGDRVFIYYSGHGTRLPFERADRHVFHREALVPADYDGDPARTLLFDHEINRLLGAITARTRAVALVLDCCHSAGATRTFGPATAAHRIEEMTARCLDARGDLGVTAPPPDPGEAAEPDGGIARTVDDCLVVAACLNHELARERLGEDGTLHGLMTHAFLRALADVPDAELAAVPWSRIWQAMRGDVETRNPTQHLWMAGNAARAVLAGPPSDGDPGLAVRRAGEGYELGAGTFAVVTEGTLVAVYGERPARFPRLGSADDLAARLGVLRVTTATVSSATAVAEGAAFDVPAGARGRIVQPGAPARLRCALVPATDEGRAAAAAVSAALAASPLLQVVGDAEAQVWLEQAGDRWLLTDDMHGTDPGTELFELPAGQLAHARDVLEHYFYYDLPLRMARSTADHAGELHVAVLSCPEPIAAADADTAELPEAPGAGTSEYELPEGALVCFQVHNRSSAQLRVTLLDAAASGKVQLLDEQVISPGATHRFWCEGLMGEPFELSLDPGRRRGIDRLIAIGTTAQQDVKHLSLDRSFADLLATPKGDYAADKDMGRRRQAAATPVEQWTAAQAILTIRAR